MGLQVCMGATLQCSFGSAPSKLIVLPFKNALTTTPAANILDNKPMINIMPFGVCLSLAFPATAAATAAALGVLTPMPCIPLTPAPWVIGSPTILVANMPTLNNSSKLFCVWGGVIQIIHPGQMTVQVP